MKITIIYLLLIIQTFFISGIILANDQPGLNNNPNNLLNKKSKLTIEEQAYLQRQKAIKICVNPNVLPYENIDVNGEYQGIGSDIMRLLSKNIDKPIQLISTKNWSESVESFKAKECNVLPLVIYSPKRRSYMEYSKPYLRDSVVIATKEDKFFVNGSSDLSNRKVGVVDGYLFVKILKRNNPKIEIVNVKNAEDGLKKVKNGEIYGYVDALSVVAYTIQQNRLIDIKIAGKLEFTIDICVATNKDEPILGSIIQKGLDEIEDERINTIVGKWIDIKIVESIDYTKLIYVSVFFITIITIILYKNRAINKINKQLEELSITDNLTKLYNRHKLNEILISESNRANRFSQNFGLIIIDIDYFKSINDNYGHLEGDSFLKEFAYILKQNIRNVDTVGRWGGEEFLVICSETNLEGLLALAEKLKKKISSYPFSIGGQRTASFGVSIYKKGENINDLINRADDALYTSKESGRNKVCSTV